MPHVELPQVEFKVVILGDTNTGKSSLVLRFVQGYYRSESRASTVGALFLSKKVPINNGIICNVQIWDIAGQTQFRKMAPMYYKTASAAIVCYDVTSPRSYTVLREWIEELHPFISSKSIILAIAATKSDLADKNHQPPLVPQSEVEALASSQNAIFVDTSAKSNHNVHLLFQRVSEQVVSMRHSSLNEEKSALLGIKASNQRNIQSTTNINKIPSKLSDDNSFGDGSEKGLNDSTTSSNLLCSGPFMECASSDKDESSCVMC